MHETSRRLLLRVVLLGVSPLVIRILSVRDDLSLEELHEILLLTLGWRGQPFHGFRIHGQEITQRRSLQSRLLREFRLRRREKFSYSSSVLDLWEWEMRVVEIEPGSAEDRQPRCLAGRAASPPEDSGGARGYMRILERHEHASVYAQPELVELALERMASALPDQADRDLLREVVLVEGLERAKQLIEAYADFDPHRFQPEGGQRSARPVRRSWEGGMMKFRVHVECVADGSEPTRAVAEFERGELVMENLGMSLAEGKVVLERVQQFVAERQAADFLARTKSCQDCGRPFRSKGGGGTATVVHTAFGDVSLPNPRWRRCQCPSGATKPKTFRPLQAWLQGRTSPELLYLGSKRASLIPYDGVARLLKDVLPIPDTLSDVTVRKHALGTAERIEAELGEEKPVLFEGTEDDSEQQPIPDGPLTIGIDGGFLRAAHKDGFFEVIAGKSVLAFRRDDQEQTPSSKPPSSKCFSFVQTFDEKPRRRLWELLKSQGMQENQQVVFLSDGGESLRSLQEYLHPESEHWLDWFHITMRLTVLQQQVKGLQAEQPELGEETAQDLTSIKHYLWHGNTFRALQRLQDLSMALGFPKTRTVLTENVAKGVGEFLTYIRNNEELIPNFGERYRQGEIISTAFVEST